LATCKAYSCGREVKAMGLCHIHLKEHGKPPKLQIGVSDFSRWQKNAVMERTWKKPVEEQHRHARARRKRTGALALATPHWLSTKQLAEIERLYEKARELSKGGERYEVDHIVPLHSPIVSGLHVPWNLRVVSKEDNNRKGNRDWNEARDGHEVDS
jgi:5-methylcytosine-specific restriction endonuclease McrA